MKRLLLAVAASILAAVACAPAFAQTAVVQSLSNVTNRAATYAGSSSFTLDTTPNVVFTLTGSASKTVYVQRVSVTCTMTTAGSVNVSLKKYSTAASGGTATAVTEVPLDSADSANTAAMSVYTADPTAGTSVGIVEVRSLSLMAPATAAANNVSVFQFAEGMSKGIVLRGTSQQIGLDFGGATTTGGVCQVSAIWIEQ